MLDTQAEQEVGDPFNEALGTLTEHMAAMDAPVLDDQPETEGEPVAEADPVEDVEQDLELGQDEEPTEAAAEASEDTDTPDALEVDEDAVIRLPDGREVRVKDGLSMQADYTKKTQELAEQRRAFESEREELVGFKTQVEDWFAERTSNPAQFVTEIAAELSENPTAVIAQAIKDLHAAGKLDARFASAFGLEGGRAAEAVEAATSDDRVAELERRLTQREEQERATAEQRRIAGEYQAQWDRIKQTEGLSYDDPKGELQAKVDLLTFARDNEITNLETAYAAMAYRRQKQAKPPAEKVVELASRKRQTRAMTPKGSPSRASAPPASHDPESGFMAAWSEAVAEVDARRAR